MTSSKRPTVEVAVTFVNAGDGGLHDVVVAPPGNDAERIWRGWSGADRTLVIVTTAEPANDEGIYHTRWFSPSGEIELCGTGAVAAAQVIFDRVPSGLNQVSLHGKYFNVLAARSGRNLRIRLPHFDTTACTLPSSVQRALGSKEREMCAESQELRTVVVQLPTKTDLSSVEPDFERLRAIHRKGLEALILTAAGERPGTFDYRYFTPWHGVDESPVAVSANALLGPFWRQRLGRTSLIGRQISQSRPSFQLQVEAEGTWVNSVSALVSGS